MTLTRLKSRLGSVIDPFIDWRAPWSCVLIYAMALIMGFQQIDMAASINRYALFPADSSHGFDPLSWFTFGYLHANYLHLVLNAALIWMFGRAVEYRLGGMRVMLIFIFGSFFCGIVFSGVSLLDTPLANRPVVGSSGAIACILATHAVLEPDDPVRVVFPPIRTTALRAMLIALAIDILTAMIGIMAIAHVVHWAGALFGVICGLILRPKWGAMRHAHTR